VAPVQHGERAGLGRRHREQLAIASLILHPVSDVGSTRTMPRTEAM
jgi:hypothetical protein